MGWGELYNMCTADLAPIMNEDFSVTKRKFDRLTLVKRIILQLKHKSTVDLSLFNLLMFFLLLG